ncbi:MAG: trypsin-like peptidase domain-containing protein, partial [Bdellovibrionales bacterium]|nr:trypsin-like peptidase domain-containing protein [Bdellovibrionales bacterium]
MDLRRILNFVLVTLSLTGLFAGPISLAYANEDHAPLRPSVIYGEDDRLDLYEVEDTSVRFMAMSTAAMVRERLLTKDSETGNYNLETQIFGERYRLCEDEPFREQRTGAVCSGFLLAPDILITAGHCIRTQGSCNTAKFVFGYGLIDSPDEQPHEQIPASNIYSCKTLIHSEVHVNSADFAVIQLDRKVKDRMPLSANFSQPIQLEEDLMLFGHPVGLPTK